MKYGTASAQSVLEDMQTLRSFAHELETAGFDFVTSSGHILGLGENVLPDRPNHLYAGPFYDPFVLFANLAASTETLKFRTSILILPAYPTALVAKQAAMLDHVSDGRFELGVGISWNDREYEALAQNMRNRGRRMAEQIELLHQMWSKPILTFEGRYHKLNQIGLNWPKKVNVPVLYGCGPDDVILRRVAKVADGWLPLGMPQDKLFESMTKLKQYLREENRDASQFSITGRVTAGPDGPDAWVATAKELQNAGATHINIGAPPEQHGDQALATVIKAKETLAKELG